MASNAYLTAAAGQLRQAISSLKREASAVRSEASTTKRSIEKDITNMQIEHTTKRVEASDPGLAANIAARYVAQVQQLENQIASKHKEADIHAQQAEQLARAKEAAANDLSSQASSLERFAGDPRLN